MLSIFKQRTTSQTPGTLKYLVVRPGATEFDLQGRIKGCLDLPMCATGQSQAELTAEELPNDCRQLAAIYSAPSESARQTARLIRNQIRRVKIRVDENLTNVDCGLWHGKELSEIKEKQPRLFRHLQEDPVSVEAPAGESIEHARQRAQEMIARIQRNHLDGVVAIVVDEPMASIVVAQLQHLPLKDLADHTTNYRCGQWELLPS